MARPKSPQDLKMFTCYLPKKDLARALKLAEKEMTSPSAIVRRAVHLGLGLVEKRQRVAP